MWLAILQRNGSRIKDFSLRLGIKDDQYFGLLACVVSGRTWNSIMEGIDTKQFTQKEVNYEIEVREVAPPPPPKVMCKRKYLHIPKGLR